MRHTVCFRDAQYLDESAASQVEPEFDTEESGSYHMGRTSPISSIGDFDPEMRDDDPDGWVSFYMSMSFVCYVDLLHFCISVTMMIERNFGCNM